MKLTRVLTDNITELLLKVVEFTRRRHEILARNIQHMHRPGFLPQDLPVDQFSELLAAALHEHIRAGRLVLCDTESVKFGTNGAFQARPICDTYASELFQHNQDEYLELQIEKLLENSLNLRIATQLLKQQQTVVSVFE